MHRLACRVASSIAVLLLAGACANDITQPDPSLRTGPALSIGATGGSFFEDFNSGSLDPARWQTVDAGWGGGVVLADGGLYLNSRYHLVTAAQYDPALVGGVRITGEWTMESGADMIQILTRSDGVPVPDNYGETQTGLQFGGLGTWEWAPSMMWIAPGWTENWWRAGPTTVNLDPGVKFLFMIEDDGHNVKFTITRADDPTQTHTMQGTSDYVGVENHIVFHNRETFYNAFIDNVRVETGWARVTPDQVIATIGSIVTNAEAAATLTQHVRAIAASPTPTAKAGKVNAFKNYVNAQRGKKIPSAVADQLIALVNKL